MKANTEMDYSVFNTLFDAVIVINGRCEIVYVNQATATLCGLTLKRIKVGTDLGKYLTFAPALIDTNIEKVTAATPYQEVRYKCGKSEGYVRGSLQPISVNGENLWLIYLRDMSMEVALETKYRKEKIEKNAVLQVAQTDLLTRLYNRPVFLKLVTEACEKAAVSKKPLGLLLIDIDNFGLINEKLGPITGDWLLTETTKVLTTNFVTATTPAGRVENNMFGLLLLNMQEVDAISLSKKIRGFFTNHVFTLPSTRVLSITVSTGLGICSEGVDGKKLFERAWGALKESKKAGKNKLAIA